MGEDKNAADDDWENDFGDGGGPATTIDPDALKKLRLEESAPDLSDLAAPIVSAEKSAEAPASRSASPAPFEALSDSGVDEFDDSSMTVMDSRSISEREASGDGVGPVGEPCPKCGVKVAPGYPKCPRCKAVLMQSNPAHKKVAGGTSVIGRTVPWTIVVIAAVLTAVIYYLAERDLRPAAEDTEGQSEEAAAPGEL